DLKPRELYECQLTKFIKPWKPEASICLQSICRMSSKYTRSLNYGVHIPCSRTMTLGHLAVGERMTQKTTTSLSDRQPS
ncbi:unnamed protein product, partial [Gulo gulo]